MRKLGLLERQGFGYGGVSEVRNKCFRALASKGLGSSFGFRNLILRVWGLGCELKLYIIGRRC